MHGFAPEEYLLFPEPRNERDIKWNFEKFLIHPTTGKPVYRYDTHYNPKFIASHIQQLVHSQVKTTTKTAPKTTHH